MKTKLFQMIIIILFSLNLTGCWNYVEINEKSFILATALDYLPEQSEYLETVEIGTSIAVGESITLKGEVFQCTGITVFDATRNLITILGEKILWNHVQAVIIGQSVLAEPNHLIGLLDFLRRDAEPREDLYLMLSKEKTAAEILTALAPKSDEIVGFKLQNIFQNQNYLSKYKAVPLWEFIDKLASPGVEPVLPTLKVWTTRGKKVIVVDGMAVFKKTALQGYLDQMETRYFLWITNAVKGGVIPIQTKSHGETALLTLEIFRSNTETKPVYQAGKLVMQLKINTTVGLAELGTAIDFTSEKQREQLQKDAARTIERRISALIRKVQDEYQSDIFGFGEVVARKMPKLWQRLKSDWTTSFVDLQVDVQVQLEIKGSATIAKPVQLEE